MNPFKKHREFFIGLAIGLLTPLLILFTQVGIVLLLFIGLTQFLYILPLIIWGLVKKKKQLVQGLLLSAGIIALLNGGCFYLLKDLRF